MNRMIRIVLMGCIQIGILLNASAQIKDFEYQAEIKNAKVGWNQIDLPEEAYRNDARSLSDLRIFHVPESAENELEQPYILDLQSRKTEIQKVEFNLINQVSNNDEYAFTFELSNTQEVNKIELDFVNQNFDWNIRLEGSMNLNSWSTIVNNYRIISIDNSNTKFDYSDISIPTSKFNYYKISLQSNQIPVLRKANLSRGISSTPKTISCPIKKATQKNDIDKKITSIEIELGRTYPISQLALACNSTLDFYRPFVIEGVVDSFKTEKGWKYRYQRLYRGTINSFNDKNYQFDTYLTNKLKLTIYNFDSKPLDFSQFEVNGPVYKLITRLENSNNMFLAFGNRKALDPNYDITYFKDKIPSQMNFASVGKIVYSPTNDANNEPVLKSKWWLWATMSIIILLLGGFSLKMLREKK